MNRRGANTGIWILSLVSLAVGIAALAVGIMAMNRSRLEPTHQSTHQAAQADSAPAAASHPVGVAAAKPATHPVGLALIGNLTAEQRQVVQRIVETVEFPRQVAYERAKGADRAPSTPQGSFRCRLADGGAIELLALELETTDAARQAIDAGVAVIMNQLEHGLKEQQGQLIDARNDAAELVRTTQTRLRAAMPSEFANESVLTTEIAETRKAMLAAAADAKVVAATLETLKADPQKVPTVAVAVEQDPQVVQAQAAKKALELATPVPDDKLKQAEKTLADVRQEALQRLAAARELRLTAEHEALQQRMLLYREQLETAEAKYKDIAKSLSEVAELKRVLDGQTRDLETIEGKLKELRLVPRPTVLMVGTSMR